MKKIGVFLLAVGVIWFGGLSQAYCEEGLLKNNLEGFLIGDPNKTLDWASGETLLASLDACSYSDAYTCGTTHSACCFGNHLPVIVEVSMLIVER